MAGAATPGHLGELTQHLPFEMVDHTLAATCTTRLRDLPARVVIYLLLAACLFPETGYPGVWRKLTSGLTGLPLPTPTASSLTRARHRLGAAPPALTVRPTTRTRRHQPRIARIVVTGPTGLRDQRHPLTAPDTPRILARFTKQRGHHGGTGYPRSSC